ncbi:MAG: hypothetical protein K2X47_06415, partial [Bdellovibrionales bacterium]|nr:hypothetical protein [Bdellovibrionales bacterium]
MVNPVRIKIPNGSKRDLQEATNLRTADGRVAGPRPADAEGLDPGESGFWRHPGDVSRFNTLAYDGRTQSFVGPEVIDPDQPIDVSFSSAKGGGASPKIRVDYKSGKIKLKFKLKYQVEVAPTKNQSNPGLLYSSLMRSRSEVRVETAVNNLAAALGFTVEPTYYKRSVRLFLPDDNFDPKQADKKNQENFEVAKRAFFRSLYARNTALFLGGEVIRRESAFQNIQQVASGEMKGRSYFKLENVQIEAREDGKTEIDVGFFIKHTYGREFKREFRAFQLFYAWVSDVDTGDRNSDLKLIKDVNDWKVVYSASDMGASLGFLAAKDAPNFLSRSMIRKVEPHQITLNYVTQSRNPIVDAMTLADAHWFLRYATQLTPEQILNAFIGAGYNGCMAEVLANKMISRRQSLVDAVGFSFREPSYFDLQVCAKLGIKVGENWQIVEVPAAPTTPAKIPAEDRPQYSDDAIGPKQGRPLEAAKGLVTWAASVVGQGVGPAIQRLHINKDLYLDAGLVQSGAGVGVLRFLPFRYIIANPLPNPTSPWLVVDVFSTGFGPRYWSRQNARLIYNEDMRVDAEASYVRERVLVRPVDDAFKNYSFKELLKIYSRPDRYFTLALDRIDSEDIQSLYPGEIMISSTYKGGAVGASLAPVGFLSLGGGLASVGVAADLIQRQGLYKESESSLLATWISGNRRYVRTGVGIAVLLGGFGDILSFGAKRETARTRLFRFHLPQDLELVSEAIRHEVPSKKIPVDREVLTSTSTATSRSLLLSAFGL